MDQSTGAAATAAVSKKPTKNIRKAPEKMLKNRLQTDYRAV